MSFEALIDKVKQAEVALEANERQAVAEGRQLHAAWTALWSPGRLLLAGLGSGFVIGLVEPGKHLAKGRGILQMLTAVAGLVASGSAQMAAGKAEDVADAVAPGGVAPGDVPLEDAAPSVAPAVAGRSAGNGADPDALRRAGLL